LRQEKRDFFVERNFQLIQVENYKKNCSGGFSHHTKNGTKNGDFHNDLMNSTKKMACYKNNLEISFKLVSFPARCHASYFLNPP